MPFEMSQKILFKHCDPAGIVFYPRYFEIINDCVEAFFDEIGTPFETLHETAGVPTAQISTTFYAPSRHGDQLTIRLDVLKIGGSSLNLSVSGTCDGVKRFSAEPTLVYINKSTGRSQKWTEGLRSAFTPYLRSTT